jgi:hypothetical protein
MVQESEMKTPFRDELSSDLAVGHRLISFNHISTGAADDDASSIPICHSL